MISPTTATAIPVEVIPGPFPHVIPLITLVLTAIIPTFLPLFPSVMTTLS
jgi:hypothetical protein